MPLTEIFEAKYETLAAFDNSRMDICSFVHFSDCLCAFQLFQWRAGNSPSNSSAVDPPGKSSLLSAASGQAEASNIMFEVSGSGSGAVGNNRAEESGGLILILVQYPQAVRTRTLPCLCQWVTAPPVLLQTCPHLFGTLIHSYAGLNVGACRATEQSLNSSFQPFLAEASRHVLCIQVSHAFWCVVHINGCSWMMTDVYASAKLIKA